MCAPPKPKQRLWKLARPPNSMERKYKTSTPKHTVYAKPCSLIKQVRFLRVLNEATSTSWLWRTQVHTYNTLLLQLKRAGIVPKKHALDNKVSENMKNHICDTCKFNMELVPPGCHRRNAAKVAISNFKAHFLSVLAGVADNFPPSLWDCLLPQTKITTNLI